jgi:hypothetical protein
MTNPTKTNKPKLPKKNSGVGGWEENNLVDESYQKIKNSNFKHQLDSLSKLAYYHSQAHVVCEHTPRVS